MKNHFLVVMALVWSAFSAGCASFKDLATIQKELGITEMPVQEKYPEADAVIVLESHDIDVDFDTNWELSTYEDVHVIKKVFKNLDEHTSVEIELNSNYKLESVSARTILPDGKIIPVEKSEFHKVVGGGEDGVFYSDHVTVKFAFKGVQKDAVLEYHYRVRNDFPFAQDVWFVEGSYPKMRNIYRLKVPKILLDHGWNWVFKPYHCDPGNPKMTTPIQVKDIDVQLKRTFEWYLKDIPAFRREPRMPAVRNHLAMVRFAPFDWRSYDDIARWYYRNHFASRLQLTEALRTKAEELTKGASGEEDKIRRIYDYVRRLRYVAIELGVEGIRPNLPETVLERQYGDCKDKSILTIALLKAININSYPALALTADDGLVDMAFPSWNFNHMIVKAVKSDGQAVWMDPTAESFELGDLPWVCEGVNTLVVYEDGHGKVEATPMSTADQNAMEVFIGIKASAKDSLECRWNIKFVGEEAFYYENYFKDFSDATIKKFCHSMIIDQFLDASIRDVKYVRPDSANSKLEVSFTFKAANGISQQGDLYFMNGDPFRFFDNWNWLANEKRRYPVEMRYPRTLRKTIEVQLDENLAIRNLPSNLSAFANNLNYSKVVKSESPSQWVCQELFLIKSSLIDPADYKDARAFFQKIKNGSEEKVVLTKK
ncbi:MAG: DUF3857 and transglutaminase domain-containing protein [Bacteroidetes bacterium]|nr:DUF3857 and transglutaminase domain-containing protein [Bacteroidota bacterium]